MQTAKQKLKRAAPWLFLLLVMGNSFGRSMFATNFCTWFYFELLVLAVCLVVIGTARAARAAALALCSVFFAYVQGANLPFAGQVNTLLGYAAANGFAVRGLDFSPVKGPEGNIEYLMFVQKSDEPAVLDDSVAKQVVEASHSTLDR